eukprot:6204100-Pleurochrysis_carterae.AAC.4
MPTADAGRIHIPVMHVSQGHDIAAGILAQVTGYRVISKKHERVVHTSFLRMVAMMVHASYLSSYSPEASI